MSDLLSKSSSPQMKLINEWHRGFKEGNMDLIAQPLHKDHRRVTYPRSLGKPEQTREEWLAQLASVFKGLTDYDTTVLSVIEAPGKVILHGYNQGKSASGVKLDHESIYIIHIVPDEDGTLKIKQVDEFTDSKAYFDIHQAMAVGEKANQE